MIAESKLFYLLLFTMNILVGCTQTKTEMDQGEKPSQKQQITTNYTVRRDTVIHKKFAGLSVPITIKYANEPKAQILVLPGWNYPDTQWCSKTSLCKLSKEKNFDLLFVEMQKSVYLYEYFPETKAEYKRYPTRKWLIDTVVKPLLRNKILRNNKPLFVMGLSTGGRGAAILSLEYPDIFTAGATLSGDFDPEFQKDDIIMINSIGSFDKFPERWKGDNNMIKRIKSFKIPLYIGHGMNDKICPVEQSIRFADTLKKISPGLMIRTHFPEKMGHNYAYWNSEVQNVLGFFTEVIMRKALSQ